MSSEGLFAVQSYPSVSKPAFLSTTNRRSSNHCKPSKTYGIPIPAKTGILQVQLRRCDLGNSPAFVFPYKSKVFLLKEVCIWSTRVQET